MMFAPATSAQGGSGVDEVGCAPARATGKAVPVLADILGDQQVRQEKRLTAIGLRERS
jgi:hypothetical protein